MCYRLGHTTLRHRPANSSTRPTASSRRRSASCRAAITTRISSSRTLMRSVCCSSEVPIPGRTRTRNSICCSLSTRSLASSFSDEVNTAGGSGVGCVSIPASCCCCCCGCDCCCCGVLPGSIPAPPLDSSADCVSGPGCDCVVERSAWIVEAPFATGKGFWSGCVGIEAYAWCVFMYRSEANIWVASYEWIVSGRCIFLCETMQGTRGADAVSLRIYHYEHGRWHSASRKGGYKPYHEQAVCVA